MTASCLLTHPRLSRGQCLGPHPSLRRLDLCCDRTTLVYRLVAASDGRAPRDSLEEAECRLLPQ